MCGLYVGNSGEMCQLFNKTFLLHLFHTQPAPGGHYCIITDKTYFISLNRETYECPTKGRMEFSTRLNYAAP
jgi:hypothetical protein